MTTTAKKQSKFLPFETELPMPGKLTQTTKLEERHGKAWDLRDTDGHGIPTLRIIKSK